MSNSNYSNAAHPLRLAGRHHFRDARRDVRRGGIKYPGDLQSAHAGEVLPMAKAPAGIKLRPGEENVHVGKGTFYTLRYGPYVIGMNCTSDRSFELKVPEEMKGGKDLVTGKPVAPGELLKVAPRTTVVLRRAS